MTGSPKVVVLDYGSGNLRSAQRALARAGADVTVTSDLAVAADADGLVVPGVGAFAACMAGIEELGAGPVITARVAAGRPVLGICNGFQILLECGLLPGAMLRNRDLQFHCEFVGVRVERTDTPFTVLCSPGQMLRLPVAHGEGNYYAPPDILAGLEAAGRVVFRYAAPDGALTDEANPNGSINNIAGICSEGRNVVGLMPHPERACESVVGSADGLVLFESVARSLASMGSLQAVAR